MQVFMYCYFFIIRGYIYIICMYIIYIHTNTFRTSRTRRLCLLCFTTLNWEENLTRPFVSLYFLHFSRSLSMHRESKNMLKITINNDRVMTRNEYKYIDTHKVIQNVEALFYYV